MKLTDFGWSVNAPEGRERLTICGTLDYFAKEMVERKPYDKSLDLWGIGILAYELTKGDAPFTGSDD